MSTTISPLSLAVNKPLYHETAAEYDVEITVSDGDKSTVGIVKVNVADINDAPPVMTIGDLAVKTDAAKGDLVGKIGLEDADGYVKGREREGEGGRE